MNILLTNDDGFGAPGLTALDEVLSRDHEVYVIAPAEEMSGISNAFTIHRDMILQKHDARHFALGGYPADCVNVGIHGEVIPDFDLVISGINHGPNMGDDTFFSGTVAGARTARIFNKNGIAVSVNTPSPSEKLLRETACFINDSLSELTTLFSSPLLLNINYPDLSPSEILGPRAAPLSKRIYKDHYEKFDEAESLTRIRLHGEISAEYREDSDHDVVSRGYIAVTPLTIDNSDYQTLEQLDNTLWQKKISMHE